MFIGFTCYSKTIPLPNNHGDSLMKRILSLLLLIFLVSFAGYAQLPPLIDRDLFFGDPEISGARLSPDGRYISFIKPFMDVRNIWVKGRHESFDKARPLTADTTRPVALYFWSHDSKYILYAQDKGGDENYRVYAVDPSEVGNPVPPAKDLTPYKNVRAMIFDVPKKFPDIIFVGLNDRRADLHDVYKIQISTGERTLLRKNDDNVVGWSFDLNGNIRLGVRMTADGGTETLRIDGDKLISIYNVTAYESAGPLRFSPDEKKFYLMTNKGDQRDKMQLEMFDLSTGKTTFIEKDPNNEVDFGGALFSDVTNELLATFYVGDKVRMYPKQKKFGDLYEKMKKALPPGEVSIAGSTADETVWMLTVSSDVDPGSRYLYDTKTHQAELLYKSRPDLPSEYLAPMKPVKYKARDGFTIPAYLTLPKGIPAKNLPVIMFIHGGPWARDMWGYNAVAQFLANRGYAVLQPNFRGSGGYGKKFLNAGNKEWGTGSMQHDITDGVHYLIKEGIADPKRVGIYGGSYGGYATLAGLSFTPDLYAAGVSFVGPSNIITLLKTVPPYWAPMKKMFDVRVGDLDNAEDVKRLEAQSPLNSARNIKAPLMVVQGANDPRVKKSESDQIVVAMRELKRPVEYLVAADEGHGFAGKENRLAFYTAMEKFLSKHVGGRYQESMPESIEMKLKNLRVDVNTVELPPPPPEVGKEGMPAFDGAKLLPYSSKMSVKMNVMGREMSMNISRVVQKAEMNGKTVWRIIEESTGPMGQSSDTLDVHPATLLPLRRSALQGGGMATVTLSFTSEKLEGRIKAGPQDIPVNVKLTEPVLSEGAGMEVPISTLPLAKGFKAVLNTVDVMRGSTKKVAMEVLAVESVTVPAGTFEAFKVELKPTDGEGGSTVWIASKERKTVRTESKLPAQLGGGLSVGELVE